MGLGGGWEHGVTSCLGLLLGTPHSGPGLCHRACRLLPSPPRWLGPHRSVVQNPLHQGWRWLWPAPARLVPIPKALPPWGVSVTFS